MGKGKTVTVSAVCSFPSTYLNREFRRLCSLREVKLNDSGAVVEMNPGTGVIENERFWQILAACEGQVVAREPVKKDAPTRKPRR